MSPFTRNLSRASLALAVAALISAAFYGCKSKSDESETENVAVAVQAQHPTIGPISEQIAADAILAPLAQAAIAPRISSPIRAEYVKPGAHVRRGQLLLTLEDRDLQGSALDSRGGLTQAQAAYSTATRATIPEDVQKAQLDVDQAKANLDVASRTAEERKRLLQQGAIAARDTQTAIAAAVQAQATYDEAAKHLNSVRNTTSATNTQAAEGQLTSAKGRFMNAEAQVGYARLRSPIDGVVTERPLFPGETAQAGTAVITVMDTSSLLAKLHIAQASAQKLRIGGSAQVQVPGIDDPVNATVSYISPALDPGSTTVEVWLKLPNRDGRFKVGTPVHAVMRGYTVPNALQIPTAALLPTEEGGGTVVMIAGSDGAAHKRAVKTGIRTPENVQIVSGLSQSDNVITEGSYGLDEGTKITLGGEKGDKDAGDQSKGGEDKD
ncbi:MAG TPA: efflux RND transporter periplasmic adaptor subunit [Acidobacteriaceae bacterium]|nr:efflux RND transporter periplasmic adaptor subunit [Acidobacteriaceae bacterium]